MSNDQKPRSATERLNDLEQALMSAFQGLDNMSRDVMLIKDAIKLLGNKLDAVARLSGAKDEDISSIMVENNVAELKGKVDQLIAQGILAAEEAVQAQSFIVVRECNEDGAVVNPRLQTTVPSLSPEVQEKLIGATVGTLIKVADGKLSVEILETYKIQAPEAPQAEAPAEAAADEAASS